MVQATLDQADQLADRVAIIDHGRVIAEGTCGELKASVRSAALHVRLRQPDRRAEAASVLGQALGVRVQLGGDPASLTFAWRAVLKIKHVPVQLFDVTMFPIMFTYLFGGALAGSPREYLQELPPGILVMTVTMSTMYTGMALNTDIGKGVFDRFRSLPIWRPAVLVGMLIADAARYATASLVVVVLGLALGFRPDGGPAGVVAAVALVAVSAPLTVRLHRGER